MLDRSTLQGRFQAAAAAQPGRVALVDGRREVSYAELARAATAWRATLAACGVRPGDRVGLYMRKSADAVAALFGILESGAAYVPVDPANPVQRSAYILRDCAVAATIADADLAAPLEQALGSAVPAILTTPAAAADAAGGVPGPAAEPDALAYILYTSGSTGRPKGVMISQRAALAFVDWCCAEFSPRADDRFSAHAPFHFDLSVFDLFVALQQGASVALIGESVARQPRALAALIAEQRLSVWYSAPSALIALLEYGELAAHDLTSLRLLLFAGEVFPVKHLRRLRAALPPQVRMFNLYGPTETNVCTFHEVPAVVPEERSEPYPIGRACPHFETRVVDEADNPLPQGSEGELLVAGPGSMLGYWGLPERSQRAFLEVPGGQRFYRTGDIVVEGPDAAYRFVGRRDRMVKRRGYRVELGEIEAGLYDHPAVREAAVIASAAGDDGVRITAVIASRERPPSVLELKGFCARRLPAYMVPDRFAFREALPRTSTGKVDYQGLAAETWTSG